MQLYIYRYSHWLRKSCKENLSVILNKKYIKKYISDKFSLIIKGILWSLSGLELPTVSSMRATLCVTFEQWEDLRQTADGQGVTRFSARYPPAVMLFS